VFKQGKALPGGEGFLFCGYFESKGRAFPKVRAAHCWAGLFDTALFVIRGLRHCVYAVAHQQNRVLLAKFRIRIDISVDAMRCHNVLFVLFAERFTLEDFPARDTFVLDHRMTLLTGTADTLDARYDWDVFGSIPQSQFAHVVLLT
jgi:hypothetical protein